MLGMLDTGAVRSPGWRSLLERESIGHGAFEDAVDDVALTPPVSGEVARFLGSNVRLRKPPQTRT